MGKPAVFPSIIRLRDEAPLSISVITHGDTADSEL